MPFSINANTVSCPIQLELPVTITTLFILLAVNIKYNEIPYLKYLVKYCIKKSDNHI